MTCSANYQGYNYNFFLFFLIRTDTGIQTMSLSDIAVGTDSSLLYQRDPRRPQSASGPRPPWRYWRRTQKPRSTHSELVRKYYDTNTETSPQSKYPAKGGFVFEDKQVYAPVNQSTMFSPVSLDSFSYYYLVFLCI